MMMNMEEEEDEQRGKGGVGKGAKVTQTKQARKRQFYLRYYVGHKGRHGHEFLEIEFRPDGKMRYANNSNYKNESMIRKEAYVGEIVLEELRRIVEESEVGVVVFCPTGWVGLSLFLFVDASQPFFFLLLPFRLLFRGCDDDDDCKMTRV